MLSPFLGLDKDNNVRRDTSLEKLAKLKPAFDKVSGSLTAGNSTPFTDGASCVLLCSEAWARKQNLPVLAYLTYAEVAAIDYVDQKQNLLLAPVYAAARMLQKAGITLQDFDFYEIHEAFAGQVLCTLKAWESEEYCRKELNMPRALGSIDQSKMNVKGGSVALGHPFGATGARVVSNMAKILSQNGKGRGLVSICTAGGMGVAAIIKR
jgi:acetyl-CoA C-acetyltransferase